MSEMKPPPAPVIPFEDFAKVDLRVARIVSAERVAGADKLLKLSIEVGEEAPRTIVAGIAKAYPEAQALEGKRIVVVANLAPRAVRGVPSQGMLLAAVDGQSLSLVTVDGPATPGTKVM